MSGPLFVEVFETPNTAGISISNIICVCSECQKLTSPLHVWKKGEEYDSDEALAELGMEAYREILDKEDADE